LLLALVGCAEGQSVEGPAPPAPSSTPKAEAYPAQLRVEGTKIVDGHGFERYLRGVAPMDPVQMALAGDPSFDPWGPKMFDEMSVWGANIVRIGLEPGSMRKHGLEASFEVLDQAILWAAQHQLYVIVDFHSIGDPMADVYEKAPDTVYGDLYETSRAEILDFWAKVAQRYAGNRTVAFYELFNEPEVADKPANAKDWADWRVLAEQLIDLIRLHDADTLVIVGGLDHGYDLSQVEANPVGRAGVVYATHPYPDKNKWGRSWDEAFGNLASHYPVFATEFGFDNSAGAEQSEDEYAGEGRYRDVVLEYLQARGIHWTGWCFSAHWVPAMFVDFNFTLSESGAMFKTKLEQLAAMP